MKRTATWPLAVTAVLGFLAGCGGIDHFELSYPAADGARLTVATMLVNANDGFTGLSALPDGRTASQVRCSMVSIASTIRSSG